MEFQCLGIDLSASLSYFCHPLWDNRHLMDWKCLRRKIRFEVKYSNTRNCVWTLFFSLDNLFCQTSSIHALEAPSPYFFSRNCLDSSFSFLEGQQLPSPISELLLEQCSGFALVIPLPNSQLESLFLLQSFSPVAKSTFDLFLFLLSWTVGRCQHFFWRVFSSHGIS